MPACQTCGVRLAPPHRQPHTVYVRKLFIVGGWHYCRHHVVAAAVAARLVTEVVADRDFRAVLGDAQQRR